MNRDEMIQKINGPDLRDIIVIGGGATGLGVALEAVTRGYKTVLLEEYDFAKGTSSRSTKLVHGGVRYLAQGNIRLVRSALRERGLLKKNASHLVKDLPFIIPCYRRWEIPFYTIGLTLYDLLAGRLGIGRSHPLSRRKTMSLLPAIKSRRLKGGVIYHDCQFDDARLAINVCRTMVDAGGVAVNYMPVTRLLKENGRISGVLATDLESGQIYQVRAKKVINATGIFVDRILKMDAPEHRDVVVPSQGVHLVFDKSFLDGKDALMIPKTPDGRVLFAIPWHDKVVVGTTDVQKESAEPEPRATEEEIDYILETAGRYFENPPVRQDVLSIFAGLRPLAAPEHSCKKTKEISRGHKILNSKSGLITVTGGKWTIFREMGEDVINKVEKEEGWTFTESVTRNIKIHGTMDREARPGQLSWYGADKAIIAQISEERPGKGDLISEKLGIRRAQVIFAVRDEMARTVEDVLARRIRALQLDAAESIRIAPQVARIMAGEMGKDEIWVKKQVMEFVELAKGYLID